MSCSVAVPNSPVFSPSSSLFLNRTSTSSHFHETLTLNQTHLNSSQCYSSPSCSSPSPSSPSSLFSVRVSESVSASTSSSPGNFLKRKRPTKLHIPVTSLGFGTTPAAPTPTLRRDFVEVERDGYSVYCKRGRREAMEDRYSAASNLKGDPKQAFFGVYDGHGGAKAAEYAADKLEKNILDEIVWNDDDYMEEAIKTGYMNTDSDFLKEDIHGGSCCVTALIRNGNIAVSNAGDCRAVMSIGGTAEALTSDHRPSRDDERDRIQNLGGYVDICRGVWRIQGSLAVSRGIGDRHLKQWVIAEPETKILQIKPEHEFLILASDGLWDKVTNQEAVDIVLRTMCIGVEKPEPLVACKKLVEVAVSRGSYDDISVMLIPLSKYI